MAELRLHATSVEKEGKVLNVRGKANLRVGEIEVPELQDKNIEGYNQEI